MATVRISRPQAEALAAQIVAPLSADDLRRFAYDWRFWARPDQLLPLGDWRVWLLLGGRRAGKTRAGAEAVRDWVNAGVQHVALVGKTPADVRDVMIRNPLKSGLLDIFPPHQRPLYEPSKSSVTFHTGAVAHIYSGEVPDSIRGAGFDKAWVDELPHFQYAQDTWDNLMFALSVGESPQAIVTTTPLPIPLMRKLVSDPKTTISRMSTYDNTALAKEFREEMIRAYEGTRIGRQELYGELLTDNPGALWTYEVFHRVTDPPPLNCVVVAIDPAATATEESDETGIIAAGTSEAGHAYVLSDVSGRYSPSGWANKALDEYERWGADRIVCETNNGGDMVVHTIQVAAKQRGLWVRVQKITASRGKYLRAEPVAALYEQGLVEHVGIFHDLERQMCEWLPGTAVKDDRIDACVYALTVLFIHRAGMLYPTPSSTGEDAPDLPPTTFEDTLRRDGVWFPRGL